MSALTIAACHENAPGAEFAPITTEPPVVVAQPNAPNDPSDAGNQKARMPLPRRVEGPRRGPVSDRDGDGIPDDVDVCPDVPEDIDGFEDSDGCPDPDNDGDGIRDVQDNCPNEPETFNGFQDDDGCPDHGP